MAAASQARSYEPRNLLGAERVAALLLTLEKPVATRLMKHLNPDQLLQVARSVADLKPVGVGDIESLIEDFAGQFIAGASLVGTTAEAEKMLEGVLPPEKITELMLDVQGNGDRLVWDRLSKVAEGTLATYVAKEHPQTAALILSRISTGSAAKVLAQLAPEFRNGLMRRMVMLKPITDEVLRILERGLHEDFKNLLAPDNTTNPHQRIAEIINKMDREQVDSILEDLAATKPETAEALKGLLFSFEDIARLSLRARTAVLDKAPNDQVVLALRGSEPELRELILQALGTRVRRMVEQELTNAQPVAQREVAEARRAITALIMDMAARGEIALSDNAEEMVA